MRHLVVRQIFDVRLRSRQQVYGIQQRLSRFFWDSVAPALEQLFDRLAPGDTIMRIDKLEIDLGNIPVEALTDQEILRRIVAAVEDQLLKITRSTDDTYLRLHTPHNHFEQWLYFMEFGILPWYAEKSDWSAQRSTVIETLASNASAVTKLRKLVARNEQALDRLILQHDANFLQTIATLFSGVSQRILTDFVAELDRLLRDTGGIKMQSKGNLLSARQAVVWFWKWVLHTLVVRQQKLQGEALVAIFLQTAPDLDTRTRIAKATKQKNGAKNYPIIARTLANQLRDDALEQRPFIPDAGIENKPKGLGNEPVVPVLNTPGPIENKPLPERQESTIRPQADQKIPDSLIPEKEIFEDINNPKRKTEPVSTDKTLPQKALPAQKPTMPENGASAKKTGQEPLADKAQMEHEQTPDEGMPAPLLPEDLKEEAIQNLNSPIKEIENRQELKRTPTEDKALIASLESSIPPEIDHAPIENQSPGLEESAGSIRIIKDEGLMPSDEKSGLQTRSEEKTATPIAQLQAAENETSSKSLDQPEPESDEKLPKPVDQSLSEVADPNVHLAENKSTSADVSESEKRTPVESIPLVGAEETAKAEKLAQNDLTKTPDPATISPLGSLETQSRDYDDLPDNAKSWQLDHAGVVLLNAYLPTFFKTLELSDGKKFLNRQSQDKAACLVHYLATGAHATPEYELLLPKILCGIPLGAPLDAGTVISKEEAEEAEALLQAVIGHWTALGKVSIPGLREGFLSRAGKLSHQDNGWKLQIERNTIDILLDRAPFSVGLVKLPWMKEILWIEW